MTTEQQLAVWLDLASTGGGGKSLSPVSTVTSKPRSRDARQ
jgi:hypothetical protein